MAAAYAAYRSLTRSASSSGTNSSVCRSFVSTLFRSRSISQLVNSNGKRVFIVDTLVLVRRSENQGVPSKHAEAITDAIIEVLNDSLENVAQSFVSKAEMQKIEMTQEANSSKFKTEVLSSQGHHFSLLQHETEKLNGDIEKCAARLYV